MAISDQIGTDITNILNEVGSSVDVYIAPSYTLNSEQETTAISKGTKTSATAFFYTEDGEEFIREIEGIDRRKQFRCFLADIGTLTAKSLIRIPATTGDFFKITNLDPNPISGATTSFYDILIERYQPQSVIS